MKKLLTSLYVVLFSLSVFSATAIAGGQTGSGGNGCWLNADREWVTLEEIIYKDSFDQIPDSIWGQNNLRFLRMGRSFLRSSGHIYTADLTDNSYFRNGITLLKKLKGPYPETHKVIRDLYDLMKIIHVSPEVPQGIYNGSVSEENVLVCDKFSPGIITFQDGTIVLFKPVVDSLEQITTRVLFVHEAIRFAQMFHPAFSDLTNKELELLTTTLFDWNRHKEAKPFLTRLENKLKNKNFDDFEIKSEFSVPRKMWLEEINTALRKRLPLGTTLNTFKNENGNYNRAADKDLQKFLEKNN